MIAPADDILEQLRRAAVAIDGVPCVRQAHALKLLGMEFCQLKREISRGVVAPMTQLVEARRGAPQGKIIWLRLDQCEALYAKRSQGGGYRFWDDSELDLMRRHPELSTRELARRTGRTIDAINKRRKEMNLTWKPAMQKRGAMMPPQIADILGVPVPRVYWWIKHSGLPTVSAESGWQFINLRELRNWLLKNPLIIKGLPVKVVEKYKLGPEYQTK